MTQTYDTPQVAIGCLASYNAGRLIYEWCDATDADEMYECQQRVAKVAVKAAIEAKEYPVYFGEPEEFHIQDYSGFPDAAVRSLGEYPDYERVAAIGRLLDEDPDKFGAWLEFVDNLGDVDTDDLEDCCNRQCIGSGVESEQDYAMEYVDDTGGWENVPSVIEYYSPLRGTVKLHIFDELSSYINWEAIADTLFDHGTFTLVNGYVFDSQQ